MIRAQAIEPRGLWHPPAQDQVELDSANRRRRRFVLRCRSGLEFLLDLHHTPFLHDGDALVLQDGRRIEVVAAPEPLTEIRGDDAGLLTMLAYHIGNRHLEAQIFDDRILIRRDHVIEDMIRGLGGRIAHVEQAFDPVAGAYDGGHRHHD